MNSLNFCYWLQGYCEICGNTPSKIQWEIIEEHLKLACRENIEDQKKVLKCDICGLPGSENWIGGSEETKAFVGVRCYAHTALC